MNNPVSIADITLQLNHAATALIHFCKTIPDNAFFSSPEGKWSPAQQMKHLIISTNTARLVFMLPKWILRFVSGIPDRPSRSYEEVVTKYKLKLQQGGRASGRFIPRKVPASYGKEKLTDNFSRSIQRFIDALQQIQKEPVLDRYIVPHPLLGKITLRELCYFTIYHTYHHLESIHKQTKAD